MKNIRSAGLPVAGQKSLSSTIVTFRADCQTALTPRGAKKLTQHKPLPMAFHNKRKGKSLENNDQANPNPKQGIEFYAEWFSKQPHEDQQRLILAGLAPEAREGDGNYTFEVKADHKAYAYEDELSTTDEPLEDERRTYSEDEVQEVIRRVVMAMQLSESPDCLFQARCILIAFGIGDPPTETELSKQRDCSRQFVSKKVKRIQELFNLSPSQYMRSEAACKAYADAWQRNVARKHLKQAKQKKNIHIANKHPHTPSQHIFDTSPISLNKIKQPEKNSLPPHPPSKKSINSPTGDAGS